MNIEEYRTYCLGKKAVTEEFPFDEKTLVFKVAGKLFALTNINEPLLKVNLKGLPENNLLFREKYNAIQPGYHMNKKHWNTVCFDELNDDFLKEMIDTSYNLVVKGLTRKVKIEFEL